MSINFDNYAASVQPLPVTQAVAGLDKLRLAVFNGVQVLVGAEEVPGTLGIYFPPGAAISHLFLSYFNLYAEKTRNAADVKGFFPNSGLVRAVKFKGVPSLGFWIPCSPAQLSEALGVSMTDAIRAFSEDYIAKVGDELLCWKYEKPEPQPSAPRDGKTSRQRWLERRENRQVGMFRFHPDTPNAERYLDYARDRVAKLGRAVHFVVTKKYHGTSFVASLVPAPQTPSLPRQIATRLPLIGGLLTRILNCFAPLQDAYHYMWSSRNVLRGKYPMGAPTVELNLDCLYTRAFALIRNHLSPGLSVYAEIIGPGGHFPQWDYGVEGFDGIALRVYRITKTICGNVYDMSDTEIREWCGHISGLGKAGPAIQAVDRYDAGYVDAEDLGKLVSALRLEVGKAFTDDTGIFEEDCQNDVLPEGFVLRLEFPDEWSVCKIKNPEFVIEESKKQGS